MCSGLYFQGSSLLNHNEQGKTFMSWEVFIEWVFAGPIEGVLASSVQHAEEVYACYSKEYPWPGLTQKKHPGNEFDSFLLFQSFFLCSFQVIRVSVQGGREVNYNSNSPLPLPFFLWEGEYYDAGGFGRSEGFQSKFEPDIGDFGRSEEIS